MDGESEAADGRSELVRMAARLIIEEALKGEASDALGRGYYARGARSGMTQTKRRAIGAPLILPPIVPPQVFCRRRRFRPPCVGPSPERRRRVLGRDTLTNAASAAPV